MGETKKTDARVSTREAGTRAMSGRQKQLKHPLNKQPSLRWRKKTKTADRV
jgi:hypothetical protein